MKLRLKQFHKPAELWDEEIPQALCNVRCLSSRAIGFESPHNRLLGFTRRSSLDQNHIDFDKTDVTNSQRSLKTIHCAYYHNNTQWFRTQRKNRIHTVATKFISKGPEPDSTNTSEQSPREIPTEPDTVALDTSQEIPPEQANSPCNRVPSPVKGRKFFGCLFESNFSQTVSRRNVISAAATKKWPTQKTKAGRLW